MTTANLITIGRILLVPVFITELLYYSDTGARGHWIAAVTAFAVAAASDGVDGYIARRFSQRSELGTLLDPLADKLLLASGVLLLSFDREPHLPQLPLWFGATVIGRDVILLAGLGVTYHLGIRPVVRPRLVGKAGTVLQMTALLWALLRFDGRWLTVWCAAAAVLTGVAGLWYVADGVRQINAHPASAPRPHDQE